MWNYPLIVKSLAIGIVLMFIGTVVNSSSAQNIENSSSASRGHWLYVGGSGPGNYSNIQDAVDNASDGDIVFIYDDSSPYHERVTVKKSITITGENRDTTIIDNEHDYFDIISLYADHITIHNLTLTNTSYTGLSIESNNNTISRLRISHCNCGIVIGSGAGSIYQKLTMGNIIRDNIIENMSMGFDGSDLYNNTIFHNLFYNVYDAPIGIFYSFENNFSYNIIDGLHDGINLYFYGFYLYLCFKNTFFRNNLSHCGTAFFVENSFNFFTQNNFLNNSENAVFWNYPGFGFLLKSKANLFNEYESNKIFIRDYHILGLSRWDGNYWNRSRTLPYPIIGSRGLIYSQLASYHGFPPNRVAFDFHPARHPYKIPPVQ
jgi:hypothetical protein